MIKHLVSIIIPAKNEEKNLPRLLSSIRQQTYKKIEIIVVDDGSTDKTIEIAKRFTGNVFKRKHAERSTQRNFGAEKSKGEFLVFVDADMELTPKVIESCVKKISGLNLAGLTIAEKTVGNNLIGRIRDFERQMYMNDSSIEVPRFFKRNIFFEFGGYDPKLTGPEDYDLPYRIGKKYKLGRVSKYILHHEEGTSLVKLLKKKYYYAKKGAYYAQKHTELIASQGNLLFRKAYLKNWQKFFKNPVIGISFIGVRILETIWAVAGYINAVGLWEFLRSLLKVLKLV